MDRRRFRVVLVLLVSSGTLAFVLAAWGLAAALVAAPLARQTEALGSRIAALEADVGGLRVLLEEAQARNTALQSRVEGSLTTLQDVYFDQLKKNDGLISAWTDPRPGRRAYLTFDDGPSENTGPILDALRAQKVRGAFFVNGRPGNKALYKRIVQEGHQLGNHTYSHDYSRIYSSVGAFVQDADKLDAYLAGLGLAPTRMYRFPGGAKNEFAARIGGPDRTGKISAAMADRGYRFFEWNVAVGEGESRPDSLAYTAAEIRRAVAAQVKTKRVAVILLHDGPGHQATAKAVPGILADLKKAGFAVETLP